MLTDNDGIVRRCVIVVQNPRVVCPQIRSFLANHFTQTSRNAQRWRWRSGLLEGIHHTQHLCNPWKPSASPSFSTENDVVLSVAAHWVNAIHSLDVWSVRVILINPRLATSNYPFDEWWVGVDLGKHVFCDINAIPFLHEIQVFRHQLCSDTSEALPC